MIDLSCPPALEEKGFRLEPECDTDQTYLRAYFIAEHWPMVDPLPWDDMQKKCLLAQQFEFQHHSYDSQFPDSSPLVLKIQDTPVGRLYLAEDRHALHVVDILLAENWRGLGIGTALMQWVQHTALCHHMPVTLSVDKLSSHAGFYRRLGFVVCHTDDILWGLRWPAMSPEIIAPQTRAAAPAFRPLSRYARAGRAKAPPRQLPEYENDPEPEGPGTAFLRAQH